MQGVLPGVHQRNKIVVYAGTTLWITLNIQMLIFSKTTSFLLPHPDHPLVQGSLLAGYALGAWFLLIAGKKLFSSCRLSLITMGLSLLCVTLSTLCFTNPVAASSIVVLFILGSTMFIITVLWMCIVSVRSVTSLYRSMGITTALGTLIGFSISFISSNIASTIALIFLSITSLICLVLATESTLGTDTHLVPRGKNDPNDTSFSYPHMALIASALMWTTLGFAVVLWNNSHTEMNDSAQYLFTAIGVTFGALIFAVVGSKYRLADKLGYVILGILVAFISGSLYMLQSEVFPSWLALALLASGAALFHLYGKVLNVDLSYQAGESPLVTFAQSSAANYTCALLGGIVASIMPTWLLQPPYASAVILALLAILVFANATLFSRKNIGTRWGLVGRLAQTSLANEAPSQPSEQARLNEAVEVLANKAALTPREGEVFALLARGYRAKQIESSLGISLGTVRNHINHIYMKLDVHSYNEVYELIEHQSAIDSSTTL